MVAVGLLASESAIIPAVSSAGTDSLEYDVMVSAILVPPDTVDSGATVLPQAEVCNAGMYTETFPVWFRLPGGYEESLWITLDPGVYDTVLFPIWRAYFPPGPQTAVAFSLLEGDLNTDNDTLVKPFTIEKRDLGVSAIYSPKDTVPDATMVEPCCEVTNYGRTVETFQVLFQIGLFSALETIVGMPGRTVDTIEFSDSWLSSPGVWLSRAEVIPNPADQVLGNNVMYDTFWVPGDIDHDVGVVSINSPCGILDTTGPFDVEARVHNHGDVNAETFWTYFSIFDETDTLVYYDSVKTESLAPGTSADLTFRQGDINIEGYYTARCSTFLATDQNWINNLVVEMFELRDAWIPCVGWAEVAQMPSAPSGRPARQGGWATTHEGNRLIYVAKGYKTNDFYSYDPTWRGCIKGTWTTLSGMPYTLHPLWGNKPPGKGAKGATDNDNKVYATQGNNSLGWWYYDIVEDTWYALTDVPHGPFSNKVKGGTDLAYVPGDTGFVYCLKGYKTEFYRYNVVSKNWEVLEDAPVGQRNKWDRGSWLVWDGDRHLYAHKAKYHELYRFDLETQKWDTIRLTGMPFIGITGRKKRSKDGGSAAYFDGFIWALKGGSTAEWWKYDVAADTWTEKETMPAFGSTGRKKRVKYGADVVYWSARQPIYFTAKGNKTVEFWCYFDLPSALSANPPRSGIAGDLTSTGNLSFDVMPNPFRAGAVAGFNFPRSGYVDLAVYTPLGCRVRTLESSELAPGHHLVAWDGRDDRGKTVPVGIYCLRLVAKDSVVSRKVVKLR